MKYTTIDNLTRKLRGRLNVAESSDNPIYPINNPSQAVDLDLINLVADEKEYFLDLILDQLYILPLKNQHPILAEIIDCFIISDLIGIHFQGQAGFGILSADVSGQAAATRDRANTLLAMLVAGTNLSIPGMPTSQYLPGGTVPRRLLLPKEIPKNTPSDAVVVNNETVLERFEEKETVSVNSRYLIETEQKDNPFSSDYRTIRHA